MPAIELTPDQLLCACDPAVFEFETTAGLPRVARIIGQTRGVRSIEFGIDIDSPGYNIYILGEVGTGRATALEQFLRSRALARPVPPDWAYVYNFAEAHKPRALRLPPGAAHRFAARMETLISQVRVALPAAFQREEYETASEEIGRRLAAARDAVLNEVRQQARARGFDLLRTPEGLVVGPVADGMPVPLAALQSLPDEERGRLVETAQRLNHELEEALGRMRQMEQDAGAQLNALQRSVAAAALGHLVDELLALHVGDEGVQAYLAAVRADMITHFERFLPSGEAQAADTSFFRRYVVNVQVDRSNEQGAPVVFEHYPTFYRLVGRVEREATNGGPPASDFTLIRSGALLQANGGYLVLRALDVWQNDLVWDELKRALLEGQVRPEDLSARGPMVLSNTLEPEPIPLQLKVILVGPPGLYFRLYGYDDDFEELFKARAEFDVRMDRTPDNEREYALFVAARCHQEGLRHFDREAVALLVELGSRLAGSQRKLSTRFGVLADLIREASYWAGYEGREQVTRADVERAWGERIYRANLSEERERERFEDGTVSIDTSGEAVGLLNGLSVYRRADYSYGQPSRVAARTFAGSGGVVQIDREVNLTGPIHNKGVLTLMGYLGGQYANKKAFSFVAQVTFEQSYSEIDGDSASCAELYAILSSLSGVPLKQNIAVTGTLNQRGQVQPIGSVTEKVEGFFGLCARRGLTGEHGAVIPAANRRDLNLRPEVVQAVAEGKFHVWTVDTVEEGLELLTGVPVAEIHEKVRQRLKELDSDGRGAHPPRKDNRLPARLRRWLVRLRKRLPALPRRQRV